MMVLPCSQLTMRMVPASTFLRNDDTMRGMTPSTPTSTAATMISISVICDILYDPANCSGLTEADARHHAAIACGIHFFDANGVAGPHPDPRAPLIVRERTKNLYYFPAQLERHQSIAVGIESRHGASVGHDRRLQRLRRLRLEAKQRVEDWPYDYALERDAAHQCNGQRQERTDQPLDHETGRAESDQHVEQHPRREPGPDVRPPPADVVRNVRARCAAGCRNRCVGHMRVRGRSGDGVWRAGAVHLVAGGVVTVMASAVTAREAEESHRGHTRGAEYHAEDVEVHRSKR